MKREALWIWLILATPLLSGGATCNQAARQSSTAPVAFTNQPSLDQLIETVNSNTLGVQQLQTDTASISMPGAPPLRASISLERPRRFRLQAKLFGPEIDMGSNDVEFWFWARTNSEPVVYFARYDEYQAGAAGSGLPIEPDWIIEALGLVYFDPSDFHEGPFPQSNDRVVVRSRLRRGGGDFTRTLLIDTTYGWVVEQYLTDATGRTLASARASRHEYDTEYGVSLPRVVDVELPPSGMSFQLEVGHYLINRPFEDPLSEWSRPHIEGFAPLDLAAATQPEDPSRGRIFPRRAARPARIGYRPVLRGFAR